MIGIVLPIFRGGQYLEVLVRSLCAQSNQNWEVVFVVDSNDDVFSNCSQDYLADPRFSLVKNSENIGPFKSWNIGLEILVSRHRYKLISVVHEDDLLHKDYFENILMQYQKYSNVDIFNSKVKIIGSNGRWKFSLQDFVKSFANFGTFGKPVKSFGDKGLERILKNNFVFCPTMIFNVSKFHCIEFDTRWQMVGDLQLISNALLEGRSFLRLPEKNYYYRRHDDNLTAELTRTTKRFEEEIGLYRELETRCRDVGFHKSALAAKRARIIKLHVTYRMMFSLFRFDFGGFRRLFNVLLTIGR